MNLAVKLGRIDLTNPVMPASGPLTGDERKMLAIAEMGVGAMVTKTIAPVAAIVPKPCIVATNHYLVNTELWSEFPPGKWLSEFLPRFKAGSSLPLIVSLGYSVKDLEKLVPLFSDLADAFELSTHYVADDPQLMRRLIGTVKNNTDKPVFLKLDPSVPEPSKMAALVQSAGGDGLVAINSLGPVYHFDPRLNRSPLGSESGFGWLSGPAIKGVALAFLRRLKVGCDLPIVGVGGIICANDVVDFLCAGASAVQLLSAALMKGKNVYKKIIEELPVALDKRGFSSAAQAIGSLEQPEESYTLRTPVIDRDRCVRCGLCVAVCPYFALTLTDRVEVDLTECFGCGLCESRCPVGAIGGVLA